MTQVKQHIHGIIGAIIFAAIAIALLLLLGFTTKLPLPPEEGILIDFGGGGNPDAGESASTTSNEQNASTQNSSNSGVNTQNIEDAASMQSSTDPNANTSTSTTGESNSETTNQNQVNPNMPNMSGLGGTGTGTSGTGAGSGNPGNGTGTGGTGTGLGGNNGDVGGRAVISNPKPPNRDGMQGTVKLSYKVDQNGTVSSIKIISENCYKCKAEAIETLKKWKYEKVSKAGYQTGTVTFIFEL